MSADIILTANGVEVACVDKFPRLDILANCGGLMNVPGWGFPTDSGRSGAAVLVS